MTFTQQKTSLSSEPLARVVAAVTLSFLILSTSAAAQTETVLHSFAGKRDGGYPTGTLVLDDQGNLYGTTSGGRDKAAGFGTVFKVSPGGRETVLHSFTGGTDGAYPWGSLLSDGQGNLFGTAQAGGSAVCLQGCGTIFEITSANTAMVLFAFTGGSGSDPIGGLVRDAEGNFYGMTANGGAHACGTVFSLTSAGEETVLYSFNCLSDGFGSAGGLIRDASGNLFGESTEGGSFKCAFGCGLIFEISAANTFQILHGFSGPDGSEPEGGLVRDAQGNLYGTTRLGGSNPACSSGLGCGTVFEITPNGIETVLYSFSGGADGSNPESGLVRDKEGNLYGTTYYGGSCSLSYGCGVVFKITPDGTQTVLYSFTEGGDGGNPVGGLVLDGKSNLYGTTFYGGAQGYGVVFKVTP